MLGPTCRGLLSLGLLRGLILLVRSSPVESVLSAFGSVSFLALAFLPGVFFGLVKVLESTREPTTRNLFNQWKVDIV